MIGYRYHYENPPAALKVDPRDFDGCEGKNLPYYAKKHSDIYDNETLLQLDSMSAAAIHGAQ